MKLPDLKLILLIFFVLASVDTTAQSFAAVLKKLNGEYRQEKLYLHTDRSFYYAGETIWFKAYLFAGNFPSLISKTVYTELIDQEGRIVKRSIAPVIMSTAMGSIDVPSTMGGNFFLRSYTKWMLNFDSAFVYSKPVLIVSPKANANMRSVQPQSRHSNDKIKALTLLQFFPEGGDLVTGIESRVAFKATNDAGHPMEIHGKILDSKKRLITSFNSIHDGMGLIRIEPQPNEKYIAIWEDTSGQVNETVLPAPKGMGVVLEVNALHKKIEFTVKRPFEQSPYPFVYVVAQMQQQELFRAKAYIGKSSSTNGIIQTENIPAGIIQVTIFSPDEKPIAERIVFENSCGYTFPGTLSFALKDTGPRKKNVIQIDIPDTLSCNFSLAVTDADLDFGDQPDNIYSRILLTGDIKGYVYNPGYYFSGNADSVANHLDLVMMTNGWRRFKWDDVLAGNFPALNFAPENYLSVEGKVTSAKVKSFGGQEIIGVLESKNRGRQFLNTSIQNTGEFTFTGLVFYDTAKLYCQFNWDKNKLLTSSASFEIKKSIITQPVKLNPGSSLLNYPILADTNILKLKRIITDVQQTGETNRKIKTLQTVVVKGKAKTKKELLEEEYTSGYFADNPSIQYRTILPDDDPAFLASLNLLNYLQDRFAGLQVNPNININAVTWRGFPTSLYVNEISQSSLSFETNKIIEDASYMASLPMSEIAMIKIINPPFFGALSSSAGGEGGAISVYLKKPTRGKEVAGSATVPYISIPGYSAVRQFFSPDYSRPDNEAINDYRHTLYWNPFIVIDKSNRHVSLIFYNNDTTRKMKIIMEGCDENGKLARFEQIIK